MTCLATGATGKAAVPGVVPDAAWPTRGLKEEGPLGIGGLQESVPIISEPSRRGKEDMCHLVKRRDAQKGSDDWAEGPKTRAGFPKPTPSRSN